MPQIGWLEILIIVSIAIIISSPNNEEKIFLDSFTRDAFSNYFKVLILLSSLFVLNSSKDSYFFIF